MKKNFTENEIREIEKQLSCPIGEIGIEVGKKMNESNIGMTLNSIDFLEPKNEDSILELGHGNCGHLDNLLKLANEIKYFGLEISETMWKEAKSNCKTKQADFKLYDGETIPYPKNFFDKTLSVNSIYFWSNPQKLLNEIERTLKPNGICVLTYAEKDFMEKVPFVGEYFKLFDRNEIRKFVAMSNMEIVELKNKTDLLEINIGETVERKYTMAKIKKA